MQHLSDLPSTDGSSPNAPSAARQSTLDEHVRARIASELARLKAQESEIQEKIQRVLERENLEKETSSAEAIKSSQVLKQELEELSQKITQHRERRNVQKNFPEIAAARRDLVACYREKVDKPLDCWQEAAQFRAAVKAAEQVRVSTHAARTTNWRD